MGNKEICKFCKKEIAKPSEIKILYKVIVTTSEQVYIFPMQDILKSLNIYCMNKGLHLSSSQVILLRPDIFEEFLKEKMAPEEVEMYFLMENECCSECFAKYTETVPLK
ncbi:hypothetical protein M0R19_09260 [Candidatus Pacearchaeota archaeon]|nr:hypothetical protein [Candidatus Pacearchaeota archaeon]